MVVESASLRPLRHGNVPPLCGGFARSPNREARIFHQQCAMFPPTTAVVGARVVQAGINYRILEATLLHMGHMEGPMKPLPHDYEVDLTGGAQGYATISAVGLPDLTTAPPREYDGPGDAWSPEHLLLASVTTCFLFTFRAVARASQVDFVDVDAHTWGQVARAGGVTRFSEIVVRATVTAAPGSNVELLRRAIDRTTSHCLVSSSLATPVRVEAAISAAGATAAAADADRRIA